MAEGADGRNESEKERLDRNLGELLQELRVALPGVQVLFAFLLTVPFQKGWEKVTPFQEKLYFGCLLLTAIAAALLISPTAYHRMTFRKQQKKHLVFYANKFAIAGLGCIALAMTGVVILVTDFLFSAAAATIVGALTLLMFFLLWFALPLQRRMNLSAMEGADDEVGS